MSGMVVQPFIEMLPRLQAEEALMAVHVAQLGSGAMDNSDANRSIRRLQAQAGAGTPPLRPLLSDLEAMGIGVVRK